MYRIVSVCAFLSLCHAPPESVPPHRRCLSRRRCPCIRLRISNRANRSRFGCAAFPSPCPSAREHLLTRSRRVCVGLPAIRLDRVDNPPTVRAHLCEISRLRPSAFAFARHLHHELLRVSQHLRLRLLVSVLERVGRCAARTVASIGFSWLCTPPQSAAATSARVLPPRYFRAHGANKLCAFFLSQQ